MRGFSTNGHAQFYENGMVRLKANTPQANRKSQTVSLKLITRFDSSTVETKKGW